MDKPVPSSINKALYFVQAKQYPNCFKGVQSTFASGDDLEFEVGTSLDEVKTAVASGRKCLIVLCMNDRDEVGAVANVLLSIKKEIKERQIISIVFMKFASDKVEDLLIKTGCSEILRYDVSVKAFTYKLKRYLKLLEQGQVQEETLALIGGKKISDQNRNTQVKSSQWAGLSNNYEIDLVSPLSGPFDCWLFRKKIYAKRYKDIWLIELIGPSPAAGQWLKSGENKWTWTSRPGFEVFDPAPAAWIFTGNKPEYSWVINRWGFASEDPSLVLIQDQELIAARFQRSSHSVLQVAQNSDNAQGLFRQIKDTYDKKYLIAGEENDIPWADQINSNDLKESDWITHDLIPIPMSTGSSRDKFDFKTGEAAMLPCYLKGILKSNEVSLLEYHEDEDIVSLGSAHALVELKELVEFEVHTENIGLKDIIVLKGVVTGKQPKDDEGQTVLSILLVKESQPALGKIKEAVDRRQREISSFFSKVKGHL